VSDAPANAGTDAKVSKHGHLGMNHNLKASLQLQKQLRQLAHRVLVAQEDERGKLSHDLRD